MAPYLRHPALCARHLAFVCEEDLWIVERAGGPARRLTANTGRVGWPRFSPDGATIAFASDQEGIDQVYAVAVGGGLARRLTFETGPCRPLGFHPDGSLLVHSLREAPLPSFGYVYRTDLEGSDLERLPVGRALAIDFAADGERLVLGRDRLEQAYWKRYRGGMAGELWTGSIERGEFEKLALESPVQPCIVGGRIWYLSDVSGHGELWSCAFDGQGARQETEDGSAWARDLSASREQLVFQRAGELRLFDPLTGEERALSVEVEPSGTELRRRFVPAEEYLGELDLDHAGKRVAAVVRGRLVAFDAFGVGVFRIGRPTDVGYRLPRFLPAFDDEGRYVSARELVACSDEGGEEGLELWDLEGGERLARCALEGLSTPALLRADPRAPRVVVADVAGALALVDFSDAPRVELLHRDPAGRVRELAWSPDGRWIAFISWQGPHERAGILHLFELETRRMLELGDPELPVHAPTFDPEGRYLYALSERAIDPVLDTVQFAAASAMTTRAYAWVLSRTGLAPTDPRQLEAWDERGRKDDEDEEPAPPVLELDAEGLERRVVEIPDLQAARYSELTAARRGLLFLNGKLQGMLGNDWFSYAEERLPALEHLDLATGKRTQVCDKVRAFLARGERTLIRTGEGLFLWKTGEPLPAEDGPRPGRNRHSGEIDLDRVRVEVQPRSEWRQMLLASWRMMRELFWRADMAEVDWEAVRERYLPRIERAASRSDVSDVIREMIGELGTSHAYELGGDYPLPDDWPVGSLGADLRWDGQGYLVERILAGDPWRPEASSPLADPGVLVRPGDRIVAVDGLPLDARHSPRRALAGKAGSHASLTVAPADGSRPSTIFVRTLHGETALRYRDWVRRNRERVRARSAGRLGYLHVPDMDGAGLSEFLRAFRSECRRDGLIVDVRENGGGFVSSMLIDRLRRRVIAEMRPRHGRAESYPEEAPRGPLVALCDQFAGSDGDIFCYAFRAFGLGPLVGKRTWGGVIGIDPQQPLVDGTWVTQPEWAFYSLAEGWAVENRGVAPDVEVDWDPASMARGEDPQLERAIEIALERLAPGGDGSPRSLRE